VSEFADLQQLREHLTIMVHNWMAMGSTEGVDDPAFAEVMAVVRGGLPWPEAAEEVARLFDDAMIELSGPYAGLACQLMSDVFDLVDWEAIIGAMRRREA
jgi:hypothetical protein